MSLNRVVLIGRLTKDPELRFTPDGTPVTTLRLAVSRPTSKEGQPGADFFNVVVWRKLAELCSEYLGKGRLVAVEGRLRRREWKTAEGQPRSDVEVVATNIQFLDRKAEGLELKEVVEEEKALPAPEEIDIDEDIPF